MRHDKVKIQKDGLVNLEFFDKFLDISKIVYYSIDVADNSNLKIIFYDENKELITLFVP